MKLECLLNILEEKELIEKYSEETFRKEFIYSYDEIVEKIKETTKDNDNIVIKVDYCIRGNKKHKVAIYDREETINFLLSYSDEEKFRYKCNLEDRKDIKATVKSDPRIKVDSYESGLVITNIRKKEKRVKQEELEHQKVIDFLNQLP